LNSLGSWLPFSPDIFLPTAFAPNRQHKFLITNRDAFRPLGIALF
jgi:hypothetical protein